MEAIEQYLTDHQDALGNLSDADMTRLLTGAHEQGDTTQAGQPVDTGAPAAGSDAQDTKAAPTDGKTASPPAPGADGKGDDGKQGGDAEQPGVILAKDGVHTIPYDRLVQAREAERAAREAERIAREELAAMRAKLPPEASAPASAPAPAAAPAADAAPGVFGDFSDKAIAEGVSKLISQEMGKQRTEIDAKLAPLSQHYATQAEADHFRAIESKHPDRESIVQSEQFTKWLDSHPAFVREAYINVRDKGTAPQVIEMFDAYKAAQPAKTAPAPSVDVNKRAEEVIAKTKPDAPASLSDIPSGAAAQHDEVAAMAEMSATDLMHKFAGKSPAEIEALVSRIV